MLAVAVCVLVLVACDEPNPAAVLNGTNKDIDVYVLDHGGSGEDVLAMTLAPGGSRSLSGQLVATCTAETLLATSADGDEIERREPGLCEGDVWRVNGDPED